MAAAFEDMGVTPELIRAVEQQGWSLPTPVQADAVPLILGGGDVMAGEYARRCWKRQAQRQGERRKLQHNCRRRSSALSMCRSRPDGPRSLVQPPRPEAARRAPSRCRFSRLYTRLSQRQFAPTAVRPRREEPRGVARMSQCIRCLWAISRGVDPAAGEQAAKLPTAGLLCLTPLACLCSAAASGQGAAASTAGPPRLSEDDRDPLLSIDPAGLLSQV